MMFKPQPQMQTDEPFEMTAMVDVVFILLTFFIISAQMFGNEHDIAIRYQTAVQSQGLADGDLPPAVIITLQNLDSHTIGIRMGQRDLRPGDYASITDTLSKINLPQLSVVVQAQGNVLIAEVSKALDAVLASPMKQVSLSKSPRPNKEITKHNE
ncbi:MAG: biopolymer transporter ExbD [Phycisphaeraceae bacterium]|nr:biopolymer transporter ExbD [Phycisphaeraceae bacterium]